MSSLGPSRSIGPPVWPVAAIALTSVGSLVLAYLATVQPTVAGSALGYALGALLAVAFLTVYRSLRNARRGGSFRPNRALDRTAIVLMTVAVAAGIYCAFVLATELAK